MPPLARIHRCSSFFSPRSLGWRLSPSRPGLPGLILVAALLPACGDSQAPPDPAPAGGTAAEAAASRTDVYTVNGTVAQLPVDGDPTTSFRVRHDAIPDFKNEAGEVVGMDAMTMPFPLAPEVSVEGLSVGDPVTLQFEVTWGERRGFAATRITPRDAGE